MPGLGPGGGPAEPRRAPAAGAAGTAGTGSAGTAGTGGAGTGNRNGSGVGRGGAGGEPLLREVPAQDPGAAEVGPEGGGGHRGGRAVF